ncbi:hypothetical protein D3C87_395470 [compost metagenome]
MAKNIVIAKLNIDTQSLVDSAQNTAKAIEDLKEKQDKLIKKGKETSEQFIVNAAGLKQLEAAHRAQIAAIATQINEDGKLVSVKKAVKEAVKDVNNSENDYIRNNQELLRLKKDLNSNDENYEKRLAAINGKLHENNMWLEENGSQHAKLIMTMNDYKQQVADSFEQINIFNGGLSGLVSRAQEAGGVGPLLKGAFNGIGSGIMGMTKAAWGFVANPIGAILTAIVVAVQLGMAVFKNFTPVVEKVEQIMAALGAVVESVKNAFIGLFTGDASNFFSNLTTGAAEAASEAIKLKEAQQQLAKQMELQEVLNAEAAKSIEDLKDKIEDQTLSEEERTEALKKANKIEKENYDQRKAITDKEYANAVKQIAIGKNLTAQELKDLSEKGFAYAQQLAERKSISKEELEMLKKTQMERSKIAGEEKGMVEKQTQALEKIQKDTAAKLQDEKDKREAAEEKRKEREEQRRQKEQQIMQDAIEKQKLQLSLFIEQQGIKARSMQEELELAEKLAERKKAIALAEYKASKKTANDKLAFDIANQAIANELAQANVNAAVANAEKELKAFIAANQSKLKEGQFLSDALYEQEIERLNEIETAEIEIKRKQKLGDELFAAEEIRIKATNAEAQNQLKAAKDESDRARQAIDLENKRAADTANMEYDLEFQQQALDLRREQELADADKTGADKNLINEKYNKLEKDAQAAVMNNKLDLASSTFGNLTAIMGKESAAGKAMAVAQATIDTYKSAVSAYGAMANIPVVGPALGAVAAAAAVAAGIANVKKITATKPPKAEKGALFNIGGNRHSAGGTLFTGADGTQFEAERGELIGVMNRNAASHFMAFNNAFPAGGSSAPNYFASGGIVSREIAQQGMNMDELALKIAEANRAIPAPVVAVQDIINQGNSYVKVREAANF